MKVIILGSGSSVGVPAIGCKCRVCTSSNPKNNRTRSSIYIEEKNTSLIVDTSPDLRSQALRNNISRIDAVFYTHCHADHIAGIDDVRSFNFTSNKALPAFGDADTLTHLETAFPYVFAKNFPGRGWYKPCLEKNVIDFYDEFQFGDIKVKTYEVIHGKMSVVGYMFNDVAYTTDVSYISKESVDIIREAKLWIVDCLRYEHSESHSTFDQTMSWISEIQPEKVVLTHMAHDLDYDELCKKLPKNIRPAFDSMIIYV